MLNLKLQYFGHLMWRADSLKQTLMLGNIEGKRMGQQRTRWLDASSIQWTWIWASSRRWWRTRKPGMLQSMGSQRVRHNWATEQQQILQWKVERTYCFNVSIMFWPVWARIGLYITCYYLLPNFFHDDDQDLLKSLFWNQHICYFLLQLQPHLRFESWSWGQCHATSHESRLLH